MNFFYQDDLISIMQEKKGTQAPQNNIPIDRLNQKTKGGNAKGQGKIAQRGQRCLIQPCFYS